MLIIDIKTLVKTTLTAGIEFSRDSAQAQLNFSKKLLTPEIGAELGSAWATTVKEVKAAVSEIEETGIIKEMAQIRSELVKQVLSFKSSFKAAYNQSMGKPMLQVVPDEDETTAGSSPN